VNAVFGAVTSTVATVCPTVTATAEELTAPDVAVTVPAPTAFAVTTPVVESIPTEFVVVHVKLAPAIAFPPASFATPV